METENKGLIDVRDCPCDGCKAKPCGHPARCVKFILWLNKTVDAVPVVRCKDCKHYDNTEGIQWCHLNSKFARCGTDWHSFPEDGFCSYGERKDNA